MLLAPLVTFAITSQKVALDIYVADEVAFRSQHAFYMKDVFARLYPQIQYRQVIVSRSMMGLNEEKTRRDLKEQIQNALAPNDSIEFLILDTHGNTILENSNDVTTLGAIGHIGPDGVDAHFDEIFSSIRHRAEPDLTVLLNSCSTFCGPPAKSEKRALAFLDYFSAPHGRIYGAYVKEVDNVYLDPVGFKLKALLPSWKIYLTTVALFGSAFATGTLFDGNFEFLEVLKAALHGAVYVGLPFASLIETLNPIFAVIAGKTFANRGLLFAFQNRKLRTQIDVQKPRDMALILNNQIHSCSMVHL